MFTVILARFGNKCTELTLTWNISDIGTDEPFMNDNLFRIKCWQIACLEEPCFSFLYVMLTLKHIVTGMAAKAIEKNGDTYKNHLAGNILLQSDTQSTHYE